MRETRVATTHVHRGPISMAPHKDPIGLLRLSCDRKEVRPLIMLPQQTADFLVAIAPANFVI